MNPVAILLDVLALAVSSDALGSVDLSLHGDAAVDAVRAWAAARGLEVKESMQRHQISERGFTIGVNIVTLGDNQRVTAFGDWRPIVEATSAIDVAPAGGAA